MQTKKKPNWFLIIAASLVGLCLVGCAVLVAASLFFPTILEVYSKSSSLAVGSEAPDFELTSLTGETVRLSDFRGQSVLLSFGASWCPDCRVEAPLLQDVHEAHPELVVLLVDMKENRAVAQGFADEFGMTHPVLLDEDGEVTKLYQVFAIPTELFIDEEGIVQAKIIEKVTPELLEEYLPLINIQP